MLWSVQRGFLENIINFCHTGFLENGLLLFYRGISGIKMYLSASMGNFTYYFHLQAFLIISFLIIGVIINIFLLLSYLIV